jgi:hypothetical protein
VESCALVSSESSTLVFPNMSCAKCVHENWCLSETNCNWLANEPKIALGIVLYACCSPRFLLGLWTKPNFCLFANPRNNPSSVCLPNKEQHSQCYITRDPRSLTVASSSLTAPNTSLRCVVFLFFSFLFVPRLSTPPASRPSHNQGFLKALIRSHI